MVVHPYLRRCGDGHIAHLAKDRYLFRRQLGLERRGRSGFFDDDAGFMADVSADLRCISSCTHIIIRMSAASVDETVSRPVLSTSEINWDRASGEVIVRIWCQVRKSSIHNSHYRQCPIAPSACH